MQHTPVSEGCLLGKTPVTEPTRITVKYERGSLAEIEKDVQNGSVLIGRLRIYKHYMSGLAFVRSPAFPCDVVVDGMHNRKRFLHDDIVAVRLLRAKRKPKRGKETNDDGRECQTAAGNRTEGEEGDTSNSEQGNETKEEEEEEELDEEDEEESENTDTRTAEIVDRLADGRSITSWVRDTTQKTAFSPELELAESMSAPAVYDWGKEEPRGRVIAVLGRSVPVFIAARLMKGALESGQMVKSNRFYLFKSFNPLMPNIAVYGRDIPTMYHEALYNYFFLLQVTTGKGGDVHWTGDSALTGTIVRVVGGVESVRANSFVLCGASGIDMTDFSDEAYACVPEVFNVPHKDELKQMRRRDLRDEEFVCSIDPSTARDLDDALSITTTPGGYRVGVHIADVSYFVPAKSALDEAALERSTSVYLIEQVIPMLPRKLSEDYCSLNPGGDKFAFSCIFHFDHHGKLTSEWFGQSVIRNRCRLSYDEAQRIIDGDATVLDTLDYGGEVDMQELQRLKERVTVSIHALFKLASKLREMSIENGRVAIGKQKLCFEFDDISNPTLPLGFHVDRQKESNWLVEEFMLLANRRVAEKIVEYMPEQALLRCHEAPFRSSMDKLRKGLARVGLHLQGSANKSLQALINSARETEMYDGVCSAAKYAMQSAKYFSNGREEMVCKGHYALALPWYTHFTSPIRRYCDIIVHRQLLCALEIESIVKKSHHHILPGSISVDDLKTKDFFYTISEVDNIVETANIKKLNARMVSDISEGLFFCFYLNALKRVVDAGINTRGAFDTPRVEVVVVQVKERTKSIKLYAREIAQEVEVSLLSRQQRFTYRKSGVTITEAAGDEAGKQVHQQGGKPKRKGQQKQQNEKRKTGKDKKDRPASFHISWGPHPLTGEDVEEELQLLTVLTAVLTTHSPSGYVELGMIIDPPWERTEKLAGIPTQLERT